MQEAQRALVKARVRIERLEEIVTLAHGVRCAINQLGLKADELQNAICDDAVQKAHRDEKIVTCPSCGTKWSVGADPDNKNRCDCGTVLKAKLASEKGGVQRLEDYDAIMVKLATAEQENKELRALLPKCVHGVTAATCDVCVNELRGSND